ncbi:MAG: hemin receptor [Acidobacteria bacterium]|nr:hemin receptor [Acidobacteriota bacterium]
MTGIEKQMVRDSYEVIRTYQEAVFVLFYGRMFQLDPSIRSLFHVDIRVQAKKLAQTLDVLVASLDGLDALRPRLRELGRTHHTYGVEPHHYQTLTEALLWAFGQALSGGFPREVRAAWKQVLDLVNGEMIAAQAEAAAARRQAELK